MRTKARTDYAIWTLTYLAESKRTTPGREVAEAIGIPETYLLRVVKPLRREGWLRSETGALGGYTFIGDPKKIALRDVMAAMDDAPQFDRSKEEGMRGFPAHDIYKEYQDNTERSFASVTIADLVDSQHKKPSRSKR